MGEKKKLVSAEFMGERVIAEGTNEARDLYNKNRFGTVIEEGKLQISLIEAVYLVDKKRISLKHGRKRLDYKSLLVLAEEKEPGFWVKYCTYKDLRDRGYIVKTALKFGAEFRVYDRGVKPGEDHARWIVFPVHENSALTWHDFAAKNRVAHSTKKRLLIGIVDEENSVTYYEIKWTRP